MAVEMVAQDGMSDAVHTQVEPVLTEIPLLRPRAEADTVVGVTV